MSGLQPTSSYTDTCGAHLVCTRCLALDASTGSAPNKRAFYYCRCQGYATNCRGKYIDHVKAHEQESARRHQENRRKKEEQEKKEREKGTSQQRGQPIQTRLRTQSPSKLYAVTKHLRFTREECLRAIKVETHT